ncbi:MAG: methionyl-tRNA formyltransferase [Candidatus Paceibacterota bacterium]
MKLNFAFFGTPDVASHTLEILKGDGYIPSLIITSPDKPKGRKMLIAPPPVKIWAEENNIPYIQPEKLTKKEIYNVLRTLSWADEPRRAILQQENMRGEQNIIDFFLVVAYGKIIPEEILNIPKLGSINIHYSLLPKYRGASPVESAILNGDIETGVTIQKMVYKMDAGPIIATEKTSILPDETSPDLRKRLIKIGGELLIKTLPKLINKETEEIPQDESNATHSKKIKKEDGLIDLCDNAVKNYNKFRAYATWPRTFFFKDGKRILITKTKLEEGKFIIEKIIPEGGKEIDYTNN